MKPSTISHIYYHKSIIMRSKIKKLLREQFDSSIQSTERLEEVGTKLFFYTEPYQVVVDFILNGDREFILNNIQEVSDLVIARGIDHPGQHFELILLLAQITGEYNGSGTVLNTYRKKLSKLNKTNP